MRDETEMASEKVIIKSKSGLNVRTAEILVRAAETCTSVVEILYKHNIVNAKSLLNVLSAAIVQGDEIELRCTGANEKADMEKLLQVIEHLE